jgi:hypothetical protein
MLSSTFFGDYFEGKKIMGVVNSDAIPKCHST